MAWATLKEQGAMRVEGDEIVRSDVEVIRPAILVNLLNPKLSIFFLAFLPQFIDASAPHPLLRMIALSLVFMALTLAIFVVDGVFAAAVRKNVLGRPQF